MFVGFMSSLSLLITLSTSSLFSPPTSTFTNFSRPRQSCKFAELSELSELSCQLSSGSAQVFQKGSQLSSAQLSFSKTGSAQLSELSELTELTLDDSAVNDVVFRQIDSYWLKPTHNSNISNVIGSFFPVLESCWIFVKIREK